MQYGILFAIISPILWALMNVFDKYVISQKVKSSLSYTAIVGLTNLMLAIIVGSFLDWSNIAANDLLFPILAGIMLGCAAFFYVLIVEKEDISHAVGIIYIYPLIVALLSYVFLNERIALWGYAGVGLVILGAVLLSSRIKKVHLEVNIWFLIAIIFVSGFDEFFVKISTDKISIWQGIIVNNISLGLTLLCGLFHPKIRKNFLPELTNIRWEIISALLAFGGIATIFFAMAELPATIVSSIAAIQPLFVILFERVTDQLIGKISKDHLLLPKTFAILLIVIGVALLYATL